MLRMVGQPDPGAVVWQGTLRGTACKGQYTDTDFRFLPVQVVRAANSHKGRKKGKNTP